MSEFLDTLRTRLEDSQKRFQATQQKLQQAQQEHQAAAQEFSSWQNTVAIETRREQEQAPLLASKVPMPIMGPESQQPKAPPLPTDSQGGAPAVNKTDAVKVALQQHPNGATPKQICEEVKDQVPRTYVYSVLKRLKDRNLASLKRGKYYLLVEPKSQEEQDRSMSVQ
jgi:hypothetical protein